MAIYSTSSSGWPVGAEAGAAAFMTYSSKDIYEGHSLWWDGYMQRLWQEYPELQSEYVDSLGNPDYEDFSRSYINQYLDGHNSTLAVQAIVEEAIENSQIVGQRLTIDVKQHLLPNSFISAPKLKFNNPLNQGSLENNLIEKNGRMLVLK